MSALVIYYSMFHQVQQPFIVLGLLDFLVFYFITWSGLTSNLSSVLSQIMIVSDFMVEYFWFIDISVNILFFFLLCTAATLRLTLFISLQNQLRRIVARPLY